MQTVREQLLEALREEMKASHAAFRFLFNLPHEVSVNAGYDTLISSEVRTQLRDAQGVVEAATERAKREPEGCCHDQDDCQQNVKEAARP